MLTNECVTATDAVAAAYDRMHADETDGVLIELVDKSRALDHARRVDEDRAAGRALPLAGRTMVVKANIDLAGHQTTAACRTYGTVAMTTAPAVRALEDAGAIVVGIANMDQFATGLVGTRSPYGVCPNAHWPELVSGGSSSGSAVAVARGWVDLGVGTDTAGSGRVPAAANAIVGLKPTRGRVSTRGVVPACRSLDCISIFARTVPEAAAAVAIAAGFDPADPGSRTPVVGPRRIDGPWHIGVPAGVTVPGLDLAAPAGAELVPIDFEPFAAAGALVYEGAFVAERYAAVGEFIATHPYDVHPVVRDIILAGARVSAWEYVRDLETLAHLRRVVDAVFDRIDVLAVPTVPRIPTVADVLAEPVERNAELGTYMNPVNPLDLCALTVPVGNGTTVAPPPSVTFIAPAWCDERLVAIAGGDQPRDSR